MAPAQVAESGTPATMNASGCSRGRRRRTGTTSSGGMKQREARLRRRIQVLIAQIKVRRRKARQVEAPPQTHHEGRAAEISAFHPEGHAADGQRDAAKTALIPFLSVIFFNRSGEPRRRPP